MTTDSESFPPRTELTEKLAEKEYRHAFAEARLRRGLPFQIRAIREERGWSQDKLAESSGIKCPNISRIENTRETFLSFPTLLKIAEAYDVALIVKFAPFSELEEWATRPLQDMVPRAYDLDVAAGVANASRGASAEPVSPAPVASMETYLLNMMQTLNVKQFRGRLEAKKDVSGGIKCNSSQSEGQQSSSFSPLSERIRQAKQ